MAVVDVLQLLHVSQKTGVLFVFGNDSKAHIVLRDGRIVGCQHPSKTMHIGRLLVETGAVSDDDVEEAVRRQQQQNGNRRPLMATLVEMGRLEESVGWRALERLIEATVVELVSWQKGRFVFEVGEFGALDDFAHLPEEVDARLSVDTQSALMEAVRILDERNRQRAPSAAARQNTDDGTRDNPEQPGYEGEATTVEDPGISEQDAQSETRADPESSASALIHEEGLEDLLRGRFGEAWRDRALRRVVLFSDDGLVKMSMRTVCAAAEIDLFVTEVSRDVLDKLSAWRCEGESPILVCDGSDRAPTDAWRRECHRTLSQCRQDHPEVPFVLLCEAKLECFNEGFALGASAVLPRPRRREGRQEYVEEMRKLYAALVSCLNSTFERRSALAAQLLETRRRMGVLKTRVREVRFPDAPSEISLVVLRHVAEYVERCVLFLVRKSDLLALGAFGLDNHGETVSSAITRLRMPLGQGSLVSQTVKSGRLYCGENRDDVVRRHLYESIGAPAAPEMVLLPLRTKERTAAVIYGDFGTQTTDLVETDSLEILADHAGMAFELALSERR